MANETVIQMIDVTKRFGDFVVSFAILAPSYKII